MSRHYSMLIAPKLILPILLLLLIPIYAGTAVPEDADAAPEAIPAALSVEADGDALPAGAGSDDAATLLIAGYDEESGYAGSILLVRLDKRHSTLRTVQIAGNCYVRDDACPDGRLGSAFAEGCRIASERGEDEKKSRKAGLAALADILEKTLGVRADGSISLSYGSFRSIVDRADGVDIKLPREYACSDGLRLSAGKNHLNGENAERFIRYGEPEDGINPQRLFLTALLKKAKKEFSLAKAITLGSFAYRQADTDIGLADLLGLIRSALAVDLSEARVAELGGAKQDLDGIPVLIVNRNWARDLVNYYLDAGQSDDIFDSGERLTDPGNAEIEEIYRGRAPGMNGWGDAYNIPSYLKAACPVCRLPIPSPSERQTIWRRGPQQKGKHFYPTQAGCFRMVSEEIA